MSYTSGFKSKLAVDDAGTGADPGGASTAFSGLVQLTLGSLEVATFDATELDQEDPPATVDPFERERASGTIKQGKHKGLMKFTKANYTRLVALATKGAAGKLYVFILTSADDQTSGSPTVLTSTFTGFISMIGEVVKEKRTPRQIPFEITVTKKPTHA